MSVPLATPTTSLLAEQLVGLNTKVQNLASQRVTYVAGQVTALDHVNATFAANILQPDGTSTNVAGIRSTAQFLPQVGDVVTIALSGAQIIYLPNGVALNSIDTPQLSTAVSNSITTAVSTATGAQTTANTKIITFIQTSAPTASETGDLWVDTSNGNKLWRWSGAAWVAVQDAAIASAAVAAATAQGTANTKIITFTASSAPTASETGDLWIDTANGNRVNRWSGSAWVLVQDTGIATALTNASNAVTAAATKIITFIQSSAPTASEVGDLWINTTLNQTMYRWNGTTWVQVQDQQIQSALTNAASAQTTANQKIITFTQSSAPTASETGDFWIDTSNGNRLNRWSGAAWVLVQDTAITTAITNAAAAATAAANAQTTANSKVLVFAQTSAPTAQEVGDIWFDTDGGMAMYIWGPTPTVTRINYALNPSFEADGSGTVTSVTSWTVATSGSNGTVTRTIATTGGVTNGSKAFKSSASSQAATAGVWHGIQQTSVAAPGDLYRVQATFQLATTGSNFVPYIQVEWLNASNGVISTVAGTPGSGTLTTNQLLSFTTAAAPSLTASARVTLCRRTAATTGSALATSDITIDSALIEKNRDAAAPTTYFDGNTASSSNDSKWDAPTAAPNSTSTYWAPGVSGVNAWQQQQFRTGSLEPQSILGNNCIAYGSITAPLLEAVLVLTGTVVAGSVNADHAALMADGLHLFRTIIGEGVAEVGTLAVGAFGTVLQWVDSTGAAVALVDEGGAASFTALNVDTDPVFMGTPFTQWIGPATNAGADNSLPGQTTFGFYNLTLASITSEIGLIEVPVYLDASRWYLIGMQAGYTRTDAGGALVLRIRNGGSSTPTLTSPQVMISPFENAPANMGTLGQMFGIWFPGVTGTQRLLLTASGNGLGVINVDNTFAACAIYCIDMGPTQPSTNAQPNTGGGGGGTPPQQHYTGDIAPSGHWTYQGGGTLRTDTTDVVQGTDPSGFNGDGEGGWNFTIPNITGTVTRVDLYIYNNWAYFNSGGQALIRLVTTANTASPSVIQTTYNPGVSYPKPGPVTVTLPSGWNASFKSKTSIGLYLGPSGTSNETFYMRADGPSARLRIWYTQ